MAILNIVKVSQDEEFLRKKSREVTEITPRIKTLIDDMTETMRSADGCGLAAVQVGVLRRIVVIETDESGVIELINPKIIAKCGEQQEIEGCLSLPKEWGVTKRPASVTVRGLNRDGEQIEITGKGLLARAICHELDHLDGILFTDKVVKKIGEDDIE